MKHWSSDSERNASDGNINQSKVKSSSDSPELQIVRNKVKQEDSKPPTCLTSTLEIQIELCSDNDMKESSIAYETTHPSEQL